MKNSLLLLLAVTGLFTFSACEKDEDPATPLSAPSVQYAETNLTATYFTEGASPVPTISWNGNQGAFSLAASLRGLTVNSTTGQLRWDASLPAGTHEVSVVAGNSAGQVNIPLRIENPLEVDLTGNYSDSEYFAISFRPDGTLTLNANNETAPDEATGTWTLTGDRLEATYAYDGTDYRYGIRGTLTNTRSAVVLEGNWYFDDSFDDAQIGGPFEISR